MPRFAADRQPANPVIAAAIANAVSRPRVPETPMVAAEELKETVSEKRSKKLSKKEFDDLWVAALGEIEQREEVVVEKKEEEPAAP